MIPDPELRAASGAPPTTSRPPGRGLVAGVVLLLLLGLAGHLFAARLIGSPVAYRDHIAGFVLIAVVTGLLLLGLERVFWRGRRARTLLVFALVQALFGLVVYVLRPGVH